MRILHVTPYYRDAWAYGGIPRVVTAIAEGQAARGHEVTVWTTDAGRVEDRAGRGSSQQATVNGVSVHVFRNVSNALAYNAQAFLPIRFRAHAVEHAARFDVAHLHACRNLPGAWAAAALAAAGVPYVLSPHGTAPRIERFAAAKRVFDVVYGKKVLADAARVVAVSDAERRQLFVLGVDAERIRVVGNPIPIAEFATRGTPGRFREATRCNGYPLVLFLGKLTARKRLDLVVDAFAMLADREARLVIAGNDMGAGVSAWARVRAHRLGGRVHFTGLLQGPDRIAALSDADVVVYPGEHEVFGLVALESLLCGTPVVVAGDSGCGDVIRSVGGGEVIETGDAGALSRAIAAILATPASWRGRVARARHAIMERFDVPVIVAALEEVYAGIAR